MAKIAVIGGTSAIARYLIPYLKAQGHAITTLGRAGCDIPCDLLDDTPIPLPRGLDAVVHLSARSKGIIDEELMAMAEINALGALKVCMAANRAGVGQVVHLSTLYVLLEEQSPYYGMYSISKRYAEELVCHYCKMAGIPLTVLRPSQVYDSCGHFSGHQPLLYLMARRAESGQAIEIYGGNDALRNYIHVEDVIEIITRVIEKRIVGTYFCGNTENCRLSDMAKLAQRSFLKSEEFYFLEDHDRIPDTVFDISTDLYDAIGYYPRINMEMGMKMLAKFRLGTQNENDTR